MAEMNWEKSAVKPRTSALLNAKSLKFVLVSVVLVGIVGFLLISGTASTGRYFITVDALLARSNFQGQTVKITGAVVGSSIQNDQNKKTIRFTLANLNDESDALGKAGGLASALHLAVIDPTSQKVTVEMVDQPMPDLLQNEAQAIITGKLGADGVFHADEVLLKCPSRYQSDVPKQAAQANGS